MYGIVELRQTGENDWQAKFEGNYGFYTIKITTNGKKVVKFNCSCPSDNYPCKHIDMVMNAIVRQLTVNEKMEKHGGLRVKDVVMNVSAERLREFIITQAKYSPELQNAILLEFAVNAENTKGNKYSGIIQKALASVSYDNEDDYYYSDESQDIDVLDKWLDKARDCVRLKQCGEAILICKAIIEEYSKWLYDAGGDASQIFYSEYQSEPFDILKAAAKNMDKKELFNYCIREMKKEKYQNTDTEFNDQFHHLLGSLAATVDKEAFIALQNELLAEIADKSSHKAETILQRKIDFYRRLRQPGKAWAVIEENLQIESFRLELVKNKIEKQDFQAAKKLINDFIEEQKKNQNLYVKDVWHKLLLEIAQKEKDIPAIRKLAFGFIEKHFEKDFYKIYKAAFHPDEWAVEREKLLHHYDNENYFSSSAADFLAAEEDAKGLIIYIEKYLSLEELERYYKVFASDFPERTLGLFKKALISYAENNTGRSHYEHILSALRSMSRINGGKKPASELVTEFRTNYKNRKAMMEILKRF